MNHTHGSGTAARDKGKILRTPPTPVSNTYASFWAASVADGVGAVMDFRTGTIMDFGPFETVTHLPREAEIEPPY